MSSGCSIGKLLTHMQLNSIHWGECNTPMYGSIRMCVWGEGVMKCVQGRETRETEGRAQSETWKEWGWFNLLSKPWNGIGVIGESKIYLCQAALHSPCLWHSSTVLSKKAISPASLHTAEQNDLQCCSSCRTSASGLSRDKRNKLKNYLEYLRFAFVQKSVIIIHTLLPVQCIY